MGLFGGQMANVVEWQEYRDDILFYKWPNSEIKRGSKLIIRAGQDAIFTYNGRIEGIFTEPGSFDIESDIIPFLSTLKGFRFGFNSGLRAEVIFINTKDITDKWGTRNPIMLPCAQLVGGLPVRAFGTYTFSVGEYTYFIEKVAGIKARYTAEDVKERIMSILDPIAQKHMIQEGQNMFNLQANAADISKGIEQDLDMELSKIGLRVTNFSIQSVSYPDSVAEMVNKAAAAAMVGDVDKYTKVSMANGMATGNSTASDAAGMAMGMAMGMQMANSMTSSATTTASTAPKYCPNCGNPTNGANFCPNCGQKLV